MTAAARPRLEQRLLLLAPTSKDATLTSSVLKHAGMDCVLCWDLDEVCIELDSGASAVFLPEEAVVQERYGRLVQWLASQPPWSDLPLLVLSRPGADSAAVARAMDRLGNVTVLERPTRVAALVSAARTALRARQRQYQIRDYLEQLLRNEHALRDADRRKDEFLAILAHELRNPLAPIRNSLHILRLTNQGVTSAERATEMMERQVNHMVRLVDDLLEVSRISRGKIQLRKEAVDVATILRSALETSRPLIEAAGHELSLETTREALMLDGDVVRLTQVIANLLNNAAKYSDSGSRIWLSAHRSGDFAEIAVRDQGHGIPNDKLTSVFDLFMQVDRQPSRTQGGLGIGLTLVKSLVELHGGTVEARSDGVGKGSEFVVRLPLLPSVADNRAPEEAASRPAILPSRRVLVVDDNRDAAESLGMLLKLLGADVQVAYNGVDALRSFATYRPAVVLLDIGMPGMDGYEVARRLREMPGSAGVSLIALTGWGQAEDRCRSESAGFDHHLVKPADIQTLQNVLVASKGFTEDSATRH